MYWWKLNWSWRRKLFRTKPRQLETKRMFEYVLACQWGLLNRFSCPDLDPDLNPDPDCGREPDIPELAEDTRNVAVNSTRLSLWGSQWHIFLCLVPLLHQNPRRQTNREHVSKAYSAEQYFLETYTGTCPLNINLVQPLIPFNPCFKRHYLN